MNAQPTILANNYDDLGEKMRKAIAGQDYATGYMTALFKGVVVTNGHVLVARGPGMLTPEDVVANIRDATVVGDRMPTPHEVIQVTKSVINMRARRHVCPEPTPVTTKLAPDPDMATETRRAQLAQVCHCRANVANAEARVAEADVALKDALRLKADGQPGLVGKAREKLQATKRDLLAAKSALQRAKSDKQPGLDALVLTDADGDRVCINASLVRRALKALGVTRGFITPAGGPLDPVLLTTSTGIAIVMPFRA